MTTTATRARAGKRGPQGWVPNQHGAWAMVVVPSVLGLVWVVRDGGHMASSVLLLVCWMVGYFAFFAMSQWLRSRFKPRFLPAVRAYAIAAGALGVGLLALRPHWWSWAVVFLPLVSLALWLAWRRRDRGLLSGAATVAAPCSGAREDPPEGCSRVVVLTGHLLRSRRWRTSGRGAACGPSPDPAGGTGP